MGARSTAKPHQGGRLRVWSKGFYADGTKKLARLWHAGMTRALGLYHEYKVLRR